MDVEGEVCWCWQEAEGAEGDLYERVDQRAEGGGGGWGVDGEDAGPKVERVGVLPVVDWFVRVFGWVGDTGAEVDG